MCACRIDGPQRRLRENGAMDVRVVWGKLGQGSRPHPLVCHVLDTAVVAYELFDLVVGPRCRRALTEGLAPLGDVRAWVALLCGLHDLGKCSPTFQALRADVALGLLPPEAAKDVARLNVGRVPGFRQDTHHGVLTAVHLQRLLKEWGAGPALARDVAWALGGHHGTVPDSARVQQARHAVGELGGPWWRDACAELVVRAAVVWGVPAPGDLPWDEVELCFEAVVALAGLASISDWIASDRAEKDHAGVEVDLEAYVGEARRVEAAKVAVLDWSPWSPPGRTEFVALFPDVEEPFPVQLAVERAVARMQGPGIAVVVAPTGEGKTKAALQAATALTAKCGLHGFYLAMPTRALSNQAYEVAGTFLDGSARLRLLYTGANQYLKGMADPVEKISARDVDADAVGHPDDDVGPWSPGKRGLFAPVAAGTVDQVLMAGLRSTHVFMRLLALTGKVVVFDEVHGYDVHMSSLMDRVLWWLGRFHVPVVLLSATLPWRRQQELVASWRSGALGRKEAVDGEPVSPAAYPRVVWADGTGAGPELIKARPSDLNNGRTVSLLRVSFNDHPAWAVEQACAGRSVAVVHNVVRYAVDAHQKIVSMLAALPEDERPEVYLLHSHLTAAERARNEAAVRARLGPDGERPAGGVIVVGTQLLEEGADLDFDTMVSAFAPVDRLIQRMGRIRRHRREGPLALALTGIETDSGEVEFPRFTTNVYAEAVLLRTAALLRDRTEVVCPDEVQELVDAVYGDPSAVRCPPEWQRQWDSAAERHARALDRSTQDANLRRLPPPRSELRIHELTQLPGSASRTRLRSGRDRRK